MSARTTLSELAEKAVRAPVRRQFMIAKQPYHLGTFLVPMHDPETVEATHLPLFPLRAVPSILSTLNSQPTTIRSQTVRNQYKESVMNTETECEHRNLMQFKRISVAAAFGLLLFLPEAARGGGVVTECTETSLRAAMEGGGTVTFGCDGVILQGWTHPIPVEVDTILDGSGHQIMISGNVEGLFRISTNITFSLVNLAIANSQGLYGPCLENSGGCVSLTGVGFYTNSGSCIRNSGGCVNLTSVGFYTNSASPVMVSSAQKAGAIANRGGTVNATNCTFAGNRAEMPATGGEPALPAYGGGIFNENGQVNLSRCKFIGNLAAGGGGAGGAGSSSFDNDPYSGAEGAGGALANLSGTVTMDLCAFQANTATGGQGGSGYSINRPSPSGAAGAAGLGGAVFNLGTLVAKRTTFAGNNLAGGAGGNGAQDNPGRNGGKGGAVEGGAIFNLGEAGIESCAFVSNTIAAGAGGAGGNAGPGGRGGPGGAGGLASGSALFNGGSGGVTNCTFAANAVSAAAGGVGGLGGGQFSPGGGAGGCGGNGRAAICDTYGLLRLANCTVAANGSLGGMGGVGGSGNGGPTGANGTNGVALGGGLLASGTALLNSLLARNTPGGNNAGALTDLGHNLSSDATCNFTNVGSLNSTDPMLGPLADNGGPTLTMALLPGSSAIEAGDTAAAPPTDQRGHPRPIGLAADIGAYEYGTTPQLRIGLSPAGTVEILLFDASGTCRLLTSSTFTDWQCVATNQIGTNGTVLFQDNIETGPTQRFYRVALP